MQRHTVPRNHLPRLLLPVLASLTLPPMSGCDPADDFGAGEVADRDGLGSTIKFNTNALYNGELALTVEKTPEGAQLLAVRLPCPSDPQQMWRFPAACASQLQFTLDATWGEEGQLWGKVGKLTFNAADFLQSEWDIQIGKSEKHTLSISTYEYNIQDQLYYYTIDYHEFRASGKDGKLGTLGPLGPPTASCPSHEVSVILEDITVNTTSGLIAAQQNPRSMLYLACLSGAVGKAAYWGYKPWEIGIAKFMTAVRVVRADYCGNGKSWTQPGAMLQLTDIWGDNSFVDVLGSTEAFWDEHGATCLGNKRLLDGVQVSCTPKKYLPPCTGTLADHPGAAFWTKGVNAGPPPGPK